MNKKISKKTINIIVASLNILFVILIVCSVIPSLIDTNYYILQSQYESNIEDAMEASIMITTIIWVALNVINGIVNRKNKKLLFWDIIIVLSVIQIIISLFSDIPSDIDEYGIKIAILNIIVIAIFSIKNIVVMVKNHNVSKRIILYILSFLYGFMYLIALVEDEFVLFVMCATTILSIIMQNIYVYRSREKENFEKRLGLIIQLISILLTIVMTVYMGIVILDNITKYVNDIKSSHEYDAVLKENLDKIYIRENEETVYEDNIYIPVCSNNKWGYIDINGNEVIPCQYDQVTEFFKAKYKITINNHIDSSTIQIAMVRENNLYKVINTKGEVLSENQGNTLPWINKKDIYEGISYITKQRSLDKDSSISSPMDFSYYGNINYSEDGIKLSNGVIINVTENNDGMTYNLTSEINGVKINSIENVDFIDDVTYSDGSIPFYSYENKIQGWFDKQGGMHCLRESLDDVLIVDVKNNNPIVKYKATDTFIINNNTLNVDDIKPTDKGYILTAKGNVMYVNANFQRVGGSYESIDDTYINEDVLIIKKNNKYSLMNTNGKIITDKQYDIIKGYEIIKNENYTKSKLENDYYQQYIKETPFEKVEFYIEQNYGDYNRSELYGN